MNIQWLKLDVNILNNDKIKLLRKYPEGDSLVVLWIGLLCMAMKSEIPGHILICKGSPYSVEDLSAILEIPSKTVRMGLELFVRFGMINTGEFNEIEICSFMERQSLEEIERKRELTRDRVKKFRERKKLECNANVTTGNATDKNRLDKNRIDKNKIDKKKIKITYPTSLNTNIFIHKFEEWIQFRTSIGKTIKTQLAINKQLELLSKHSVEVAIEIIDNSIRNEYQGLFEPKDKKQKRYLSKKEQDAKDILNKYEDK